MMEKLTIVIFVICLAVGITSGQIVPAVPCPQYFKYISDPSGILGFIEVPAPPLGTTLKLNVVLSLRERLPSNYPGSLELQGTREQALQKIFKSQPVQYRIRFPLPSPLPKLTQLLYNNQIICSGPPDQGPVLTTIRLEHTLYTQLASQHVTNNFQEVNIIPGQFGGGSNILYQPTSQQFTPNTNENFVTFTPAPVKNFNPPQVQTVSHTNPTQGTLLPIQPSAVHPNVQPTAPTQQFIQSNSLDTPQDTNEVCGQVHPKYSGNPLVIGGTTIQRGTWPWLVGVYMNSGTTLKFLCGGNLVSHIAVLTAAHCFMMFGKKLPENQITVFLGRHNIKKWSEEGSTASGCQQLYMHPDYKKASSTSFDADIAIVILDTTVKYTEYIRPACLWPFDEDIRRLEKQEAVIVGWGKDASGQSTTPEPNRIRVKYVSEVDCLRSNDNFRLLTSNRTFCAGNQDGTGPCTGDSGGGLMMYRDRRWTIRGLVSVSLGDSNLSCDLEKPVVYSDVAKFLDWIGLFVS